MPDELVYHQQTVSLLDPVPQVSSEAQAALDERERALGIRIPAAVREWYSLEGAVRLLETYSNDDNPIPIENLGERDEDWYAFQEVIRRQEIETDSPGLLDPGDPEWQGDTLDRNRLVFMYAHQSVCRWAVPLDRGDDPVVLVQNDGMTGWRKASDRFSSFVYTYIWNHSRILDAACILEAKGDSIALTSLAFLREHVLEAPTTYVWPDYDMDHRYDHYRFLSDDGGVRILIQDVASERSVWHLAADTLLALGHLATALRDQGAFTGDIEVRMRCKPGLDLSWHLYPDSSPGTTETLGQLIDRLGRQGEAWTTVGRPDRRPTRIYACIPDDESEVSSPIRLPFDAKVTDAHFSLMTNYTRQRGNATDG
jgi:hypothetical protein